LSKGVERGGGILAVRKQEKELVLLRVEQHSYHIEAEAEDDEVGLLNPLSP